MIRNKKRPIIMSIIVIVLLLGVGYAYLNSNLSVNGTTNVTSSSWDVHWANVSVSTGSVTGTQVTTPAYIKSGLTEVEYNITLKEPGDYYEFTVDAVNNGSIDAMIESFSNKVYQSNGTTERQMPAYLNFTVTYEDGIALGNNHLLEANTTETYKVRVEFRTDINPSDLPSTNDSMIFKFRVAYVQASGSATTRPSPFVYTINMTPTELSIGSAIPGGVTTYNNYQDAITAFGHNFFLRHKLESNLITESYVGFVYNNNVYYLRGGVDEDELSTQPIYESNKATLISAFGSSNCSENVNDFSATYLCTGNDINADVNNGGALEVYNGDGGVNITSGCGIMITLSCCGTSN